MGNSEKELFDRIAKDEPPASSASDQLRKDLVQWFEGRRNVALIYMMLWVIASIVPICTGFYIVFGGGRDTRFLLIAVTLIILGLSVNVLVKLWYWIIDNKISVIKELKLLQLTALNSQHTEDSRPDSLDVTRLGTLLPWTTSAKKHAWLERIRPRTLRWISLIVLLACVAGLVQVSNSVMPLFRDKTGVEQRDEWMITQSGDIRASSRLTFRGTPNCSPFMTVALPYAQGRITAVTADGNPLLFQKLDWRRYEIQVPILDFPLKESTTVVVEWSFPMGTLMPVEKGYRTALASLLPVDCYSLDVVLAPDCGFEVIGEPETQTIRPFYSTGRGIGEFFGACGIWIQKRAEDAA